LLPSDGEQSFGATPINFGRRDKAQARAEGMVLVLNGDGSVACRLSARALAYNVCRTTNAQDCDGQYCDANPVPNNGRKNRLIDLDSLFRHV
jgi:hypothetical protein